VRLSIALAGIAISTENAKIGSDCQAAINQRLNMIDGQVGCFTA
jgi:hypothetical protein